MKNKVIVILGVALVVCVGVVLRLTVLKKDSITGLTDSVGKMGDAFDEKERGDFSKLDDEFDASQKKYKEEEAKVEHKLVMSLEKIQSDRRLRLLTYENLDLEAQLAKQEVGIMDISEADKIMKRGAVDHYLMRIKSGEISWRDAVDWQKVHNDARYVAK